MDTSITSVTPSTDAGYRFSLSITSIFIISFISFLVGGIVISLFDPYFPLQISNAKKAHQAGYDSAQKLVEQSPLGKMFVAEGEIHTLSGVIFSKDNSSITVRVGSMNPFDDPALTDRLITINSSTTIVKLVSKDPRQFQSEVYSYFNGSSSPQGKDLQPFIKVPGSISDLEIGSPVSVTAAENIKSLKNFSAQEIDIQYRAKPTSDTSVSTSTTAK